MFPFSSRFIRKNAIVFVHACVTNPLFSISVDVSGSRTLCVFLLYGCKPDQHKQMSVSISGGCTSTVAQRNSYRKRLTAFGLILVELRDVVTREGLKG